MQKKREKKKIIFISMMTLLVYVSNFLIKQLALSRRSFIIYLHEERKGRENDNYKTTNGIFPSFLRDDQ